MSHIVTRLYADFFDAQHAVIELERVGVAHGDISLISSASDHAHAHVRVRAPRDRTAGEAATVDAGVGAAIGGTLGAVGGALAGLGLIAIPGLGPVVAAGWLAAGAIGAAVGGAVLAAGGGLVGAMTNAGVSEAEAHVYAEGVKRGGTLVSAKVADHQLGAAEAALSGVPSVDVAARGQAYRAEGWRQFDTAGSSGRAEPGVEDRVLADRDRHSPI